MKRITLKSPAKINLTLDVIKKSENNFHEIRSIVVPIFLHDTITATIQKHPLKNKQPQIILNTTGLPSPSEKQNSAYIAARLFIQATKIRQVITITIHKRIPLRSGLGGGSSNAATTLLALQKLYDSPLSPKKLHALAQKIGMDTPFFLNPTLSLTTHFGEKCTPIVKKNPKLPSPTLIFPKHKKKSTATAYNSLNLSLCNKQKQNTVKLLKILKTSPHIWQKSWNSLLHNDFSQLYSPSSTGRTSYLTGSGPTRFMM